MLNFANRIVQKYFLFHYSLRFVQSADDHEGTTISMIGSTKTELRVVSLVVK